MGVLTLARAHSGSIVTSIVMHLSWLITDHSWLPICCCIAANTSLYLPDTQGSQIVSNSLGTLLHFLVKNNTGDASSVGSYNGDYGGYSGLGGYLDPFNAFGYSSDYSGGKYGWRVMFRMCL